MVYNVFAKKFDEILPNIKICLIVRIRFMPHRQARSELALRESELQQKVEEVAVMMIMILMIMLMSKMIIMLMSKILIMLMPKMIIMLMSKMVIW